MSAVVYQPAELERWLELCWPDQPTHLRGRLGVSQVRPGVGLRTEGQVYPTGQNLPSILEKIGNLDRGEPEGIYLSCCTVDPALAKGTKRGTANEAMDLPGLWADVDIKGPGHQTGDYPPSEDAARVLIAQMPLEPTAIVHSGGGLYPWWLLEEPLDLTQPVARDRATALSKRWGGWLKHLAAERGWSVDSVGDLARILRAPGTVNRKVGERPCRITDDGGPRYSLEELEKALDAAGALPVVTRQREASVRQPGDQFSAPADRFEDAPAADEPEVLARVHELAAELKALKSDVRDWCGVNLPKIGNYVGAGQLSEETATRIMLGAFEDWTWREPGHRRKHTEDVIRQIKFGMQSPRPWQAEDRPPRLLRAAMDGGGRHLRLVPASSIKIRRTRWTWEGRVPAGSLVLLAGREGLGKSTVGYWLAARITRGELHGEHLGAPMAVLVCATEDSWSHTIVPRLVAHGADLERVFRVDVLSADEIEVGLSLPADLAGIEEAAREQGAALLLLDPLMSRLDAGLDTHKDAEVRRALEPLTVMADRTGMAVVGLIHLNKSGGSDALNQVMASRAFPAVARAVLHVVPDPDDETDRRRLLALSKNNLGRTDLPLMPFTIENFEIETDDDGTVRVGQIAWQEEIEGTIRDVMQRAEQDSDSRSASSEAGDWLEDWLAQRGGEAASQDAKKAGAAEGHSQDALKRAVKQRKGRLGYRSEGMPRRTIWFLTP